jgi:pimeloyl-ACP methyl ester carboxylesterase
MKTRRSICISVVQKAITVAVIFCSVTVSSFSQANQNKTAATSGYAPVNGLKMYYEIHGEGMPLVLLHGAFMTINTNWSALIPELSKNRKVIAVELQGHGRTADIDRPFSFEYMADDVVALLQYLKIDSTDIFGYSLGGCVALQIAIRHPQIVRKLVIASAVYKFEGWTPETRAILPTLTPALFEGSPMKKEYDSLAPDPKHWPQMVDKLKKLVTTPYDFTAEKIKSIKSPALIIVGDGDGVLPEHAVEMFRLLGGKMMPEFSAPPHTQLAMFPGTSHIFVMMHPDWLLSMIPPFLDAPMTKAQQ